MSTSPAFSRGDATPPPPPVETPPLMVNWMPSVNRNNELNTLRSVPPPSPLQQHVMSLNRPPTKEELDALLQEGKDQKDREERAENRAAIERINQTNTQIAVNGVLALAHGSRPLEAIQEDAVKYGQGLAVAGLGVCRELATEYDMDLEEYGNDDYENFYTTPLSNNSLAATTGKRIRTNGSCMGRSTKRTKTIDGRPPRPPSSVTQNKVMTKPTSVTKASASPKTDSKASPASLGKKKAESQPSFTADVKLQASALIVKSTHMLGYVPHQEWEGYRTLYDYGHTVASLEQLLTKYPDHNLFLFMEQEGISVGDFGLDNYVLQVLIVPAGESPPELLHLKSVAGDDPLEPFDKHSLEWLDIKDIVVPSNQAAFEGNSDLLKTFFKSIGGRIFILHYKGRSLRNLDEAEQAIWNRMRLLDARSFKFPEHDEKGRILVESASFQFKVAGKTYTEVFAKGSYSVAEEADFIVDEFPEKYKKAKGVPDATSVAAAIRGAFNQKRESIQAIAEKIKTNHSLDKIDQIQLAKVYPKNITQVTFVGAKEVLEEKQAREEHSSERIANGNAQLDVALARFTPQYSTSAVSYGPVQDRSNLFYGRDDDGEAK